MSSPTYRGPQMNIPLQTFSSTPHPLAYYPSPFPPQYYPPAPYPPQFYPTFLPYPQSWAAPPPPPVAPFAPWASPPPPPVYSKDLITFDDVLQAQSSLYPSISPSQPSTSTYSATQPDNTVPVHPLEGIRTRCIRCTKYYEFNVDDGPCTFHSGKWKPFYKSSMGPSVQHWTCCKSMEEKEVGCKVAPCHREDKATTEALSRFSHAVATATRARAPPHLASMKTGLLDADLVDLSSPEVQPAGPEGAEKQVKAVKAVNAKAGLSIAWQDDPRVDQSFGSKFPFIVDHHVIMTDTLVGISLMYGVASADIKRLNKLANDPAAIYARARLWIPSSQPITSKSNETEQQRRDRLIKQFARHANAREEDAKFYLTSNDFDLESAKLEYDEDVAWEKANPQKKKKAK